MRIGIRREDKNQWEARVPITPKDAGQLIRAGIDVWLQPSSLRVFPDDTYRKVGATISEDLSPCPIILAVKEIPATFFEAGKTYVFFSHTIKGQAYNMPMLKKMMDLKCQLIDYELVTDDRHRRLIFFGRHAGLAGMIDTLWAFGKRLAYEGIANPFDKIKLAHQYHDLYDAKAHIAEIGVKIKVHGLPREIQPLIIGFAGYGNVSQGAQEIFDLLPFEQISPAQIAVLNAPAKTSREKLFKVVFREEDMVVPQNAGDSFDLQDYYDHPEKYRGRFEDYLPYLDILVNCIYWESRYPRLVTGDYLKRAFSAPASPKLRVIGDISCDIEGAIQCTVKSTDPGKPVYVFDPTDGTVAEGWEGHGPVIMAVDNLPCELSKESSEFFSNVLVKFVPALVKADYRVPYEQLQLPPELHRAMILHRGELLPKFQHLKSVLSKS